MIGLYFRNIFPIGGLILSWSLGRIFQSRTSEELLANSKALNTCKVKKRR